MEALRAFGATAEQLGEAREALALRRAADDDVFYVFAGNWTAVRVFMALETQWRLAPMGQLIGLDYGAIPATLRLMNLGRRTWAETFDKLRTLEKTALEAMR